MALCIGSSQTLLEYWERDTEVPYLIKKLFTSDTIARKEKNQFDTMKYPWVYELYSRAAPISMGSLPTQNELRVCLVLSAFYFILVCFGIFFVLLFF